MATGFPGDEGGEAACDRARVPALLQGSWAGSASQTPKAPAPLTPAVQRGVRDSESEGRRTAGAGCEGPDPSAQGQRLKLRSQIYVSTRQRASAPCGAALSRALLMALSVWSSCRAVGQEESKTGQRQLHLLCSTSTPHFNRHQQTALSGAVGVAQIPSMPLRQAQSRG